MAPRLNRWIIAGAVGCLLIAVSYLPPRGTQVFSIGHRFIMPVPTAAEVRRQSLAAEWSETAQRLRSLQYRREAEPALAARRAAELPGAEVIIDATDGALSRQKAVVTTAIDSAWQVLQLGVPKVSVLVVVPGDTPVRTGPLAISGSSYLLPDSTDRTTCVMVLTGGNFWIRQAVNRPGLLTEWMSHALGPCAFYARFGVPSPRVQHWLSRGKYDVVESSAWVDWPVRKDEIYSMLNLAGRRWWWGELYGLRFGGVACLAGRAADCRAAIRLGDDQVEEPVRRVARPGERWRLSDARVLGHEVLLARVVHDVGEQRFQEFWTTTLPIDSALTIALHEPVGEWVARWQGTLTSRPQLGAAPRWLDTLLSVVLVGLVLTGAGWIAQRRQVG